MSITQMIDQFKLVLHWEEEEGGGWICTVRPVLGGHESFGNTSEQALNNWLKFIRTPP
jgi:hypothetical protein